MPDMQARVGVLIEAEARVDAAQSKLSALYATAANGPKALSAEIAKNTQVLSMYGRTVDTTNASAVTAWRESAAAEMENLQALKANEEQMLKLQLVTQQFEKRVAAAGTATAQAIPPIRGGASALAFMAMSLDGADMSARGVIRSTSILAMTMGNSIPGLQQYAGSIAAIGVELGLVYDFWKKMSAESTAPSALFLERLAMINKTVGQGIHEQLNTADFDRLEQQIEDKRKRADALEAKYKGRTHLFGVANDSDELADQREATRLRQEAQGEEDKLQQTRQQAAHEAARSRDQARLQEEQAAAAKRLLQQEEAERTATSMMRRMKDDESAYIDKQLYSQEQQAKRAADRERANRDDEIRALDIDEHRKNELLVASAHERNEQIAAIDKEARDKEAKEREKVAKKADEDYRRGLAAIERATQHSIDMIVRSHRLSAPAIAAAMLAPLVTYMEGESAKDAIAGGAHLLTGDFLQAGQYLAASALWAAGAMEVAGIGGTSSGGRGGGGASGGGGAGTFQPRDSSAAQGGVTINLMTKDPYGRDQIRDTIYHLDQAQLYNTPIYVPPTTGFQRAG